MRIGDVCLCFFILRLNSEEISNFEKHRWVSSCQSTRPHLLPQRN